LGVYFTYVGGKNPWADWPLIFCGGRYPRRNHVFQIWWRSVQRFSVGWGSNFAIPHWLWRSSLQHSHTTVWACDSCQKYTVAYRNGGPMFGSVNCRFSRCKFLCFWWCERERRPAAVTICICNGHISPWCRVALCQAPRHVTWCLTFRLVEWKRLLRSPSATQRRTP